ncbi:MAG: S1C family serine protease [Ktedonobacterales bacterium]
MNASPIESFSHSDETQPRPAQAATPAGAPQAGGTYAAPAGVPSWNEWFASAAPLALPAPAQSEQPGNAAEHFAPPPLPPVGGDGQPPYGAQPRRPRRRLSALLGLALLFGLVAGGGAGIAIGVSRASAANSPAAHTLVLGAPSAPAISISSTTTSIQQSVVSVAKAVEPSVVKITSVSNGQEAIGSGNILTANGYIVTNDHVVRGFSSFTVTLSNGTSYPAQLIGQDPQDDLAVLKINATNLKPIAFADSSKVQVGEFSIAVGNPLALQESATLGVVSAVNGTASEAPNGPASTLTGLIQTSAPINPGNSGGALVNLQGQLVGIPTLEETNPDTGTAAGIGYAIPANRVQYVASQLIAHGQLTSSGQGFIGIQAQDVTPQLAAADGLSVQSGVLVTGFASDAAGQSPAQLAGLQTGDVITAVNGHAVTSNSDLASALLNQAPGTQVTLTLMRGSSQQSLTITLGERPANAQG